MLGWLLLFFVIGVATGFVVGVRWILTSLDEPMTPSEQIDRVFDSALRTMRKVIDGDDQH